MKKQIIYLSILAAGFIIIFFSCSKQEETSKIIKSPELSEYEMQVNKTIKDFKQKVAYYRENPHLKSGDAVPADSAIWYLESTINYSHSFPNEFYKEMQSDELTLVVPKNASGEVDMVVLTQKYDEMKADVTNIYYNSGFEEKGLVLVDLSEISQTADEITLRVGTVTGNKNNEPPPYPVNGPFEEEDNWWYGDDYGYCYDHSVLDDAANQLFNAVVPLIPDPGGNYYFINEFTFTVEGGDPDLRRDNDDLDNYLDYYLYTAVEGNPLIPFNTEEMLCVEWQEMNHYWGFLKNLIFNILPNEYLPEHYGFYGYSIECFNLLEDDKVDEVGTEITRYFHRGEFTYGEKVCYDEGDSPTEL